MSIYDSIDKDYTPAGASTADIEGELPFKILATFEREQVGGKFDITKVEIVDGPRAINFGFVEPDYDPEPEEDYRISDKPRGMFNDEVPL
jgi:hypothetical protein